MDRDLPRYFHLHLISDSTGETLTTIAKAAVVQYPKVRAIEHVHPLVRSERQIERVMQEVSSASGIVLYTIVNTDLRAIIERRCAELSVPCVHVLDPVMKVLESYLGAPQSPTVGGQHVLDADYFRRIDALNFCLVHDDGRLPANIDDADIIIVGISRTSKTPTSIYLANRGYKTANYPLVPGVPVPPELLKPTTAFIVGLVAAPERIAQIRQNRVMMIGDRELGDYVDRGMITDEINTSRRLFTKQGWKVIDVTRRSIEETAAAILKLYHDREAGLPATDANGVEAGTGGSDST